MDAREHSAGVLPPKRLQRIQTLSVLCQTHRNDGHAFHIWEKRSQIANRPLKFLPVIHILAQYDLPVHLDARIREFFYLF